MRKISAAVFAFVFVADVFGMKNPHVLKADEIASEDLTEDISCYSRSEKYKRYKQLESELELALIETNCREDVVSYINDLIIWYRNRWGDMFTKNLLGFQVSDVVRVMPCKHVGYYRACFRSLKSLLEKYEKAK